MTTRIRKVITGHDGRGRAVVERDEVVEDLVPLREGADATVIWSTSSLPADNTEAFDDTRRDIPTAEPEGTVFRIVRYAPGVAPRRHRTLSIDYAVVMSGEIVMELDGDETVRLRAGDVLVQRGTIHNWVNPGPEPCVIAFVLVGAKPVEMGGETLGEAG